MSESKPIAATYARVSNPHDRREASIVSQEKAAVALLEEAGYEVPVEHRLREHFSGVESIHDRPVLARIRELASRSIIGAVGFYDTDRLARDPDELAIVVRGLTHAGCKPLFVQMSHETETRLGKMVLYIKGLASALEYDAIRDRTTRGKARITAAGQMIGSGPVKFGYVWRKETRSRQAHPEEATVVRRVFELVASGHSSYKAARLLNAEGLTGPRGSSWSSARVCERIRDRTYLGEVVIRKTMTVAGRYPCGKRRMASRPDAERLQLSDPRTEPLVSPELFARAGAILDMARTERPTESRSRRHLLAGRIWCTCGRRMTPQWSITSSRGYRYRSYTYRCGRRHGCGITLGQGWLDDLAWALVMDLVNQKDFFEVQVRKRLEEETPARLQEDLAAAERKREKCIQDIRRLFNDQLKLEVESIFAGLIGEKLTALEREVVELDGQIKAMRSKLVPVAEELARLERYQEIVEEIRRQGITDSMDFDSRRDVINVLSLGFVPTRDRTCAIRVITNGSSGRTKPICTLEFYS